MKDLSTKSIKLILNILESTLKNWRSSAKKMIEDKNFRIGRPRQLYTGKSKTSYKNIKDR